MKTTSWPLNYPKSDEWPPRKRFPVVNSYANYPGMEIINNALKYSEVDFNRLYTNELVSMAKRMVIADIGMERYKIGDYNYGLLHPNNAINRFLRQAIETEFKQNLEPELRKLWKPILMDLFLNDYDDEDSVREVEELIDFSIRHLKMTLESALLGGTSMREQGKQALGEQLAQARLLANDDLHWVHSSTKYETLINQPYPNAPFRNAWDEPAPFSRYVLGKYPETLFDICGIREFDVMTMEVQVFTYAQAVERAKQYIEPLIGEFDAYWLSNQTGLPQAIFTGLRMTANDSDRESSVMALVNVTCGIDELVEEAVTGEDGFNRFLGWEYSNEDNPYKIFNQEYLVGVFE